MNELGMDIDILARLNIGPVLFREATMFSHEVGMNENIKVDAKLKSTHEDGSRWSFIHEFITADGHIAVSVTVDGAWIDLKKCKLTTRRDPFREVMLAIPRSDDFALMPAKT